MKSSIIFTLFLFILVSPVFAQQKDDSLIEKLETRVEKIEGFQKVTEGLIQNKFDNLSSKINNKYNLILLLELIGIGIVTGGFWKGREYVKKVLKNKFDNIIDQHESDIIMLIDKQNIENQLLKKKKILVLTPEDESDFFIKRFFKVMKFERDNVYYKKVNEYYDFGEYDLIFINNENDKFDFNLIDEYFERSNEQTVLFYFNTTRHNYINENVSERMNFANAKTQIYGNLINLLKYQEILRLPPINI